MLDYLAIFSFLLLTNEIIMITFIGFGKIIWYANNFNKIACNYV